MTKNPVLNALLAAAYIAIVASVMYFGSNAAEPHDTVLAPIALLSLFSLSAVMMAFIFFYQPVLMYFEDQKASAVKLVMQTVAAFAIITAVFLASLFSSAFF